jgi:hypothetical protein
MRAATSDTNTPRSGARVMALTSARGQMTSTPPSSNGLANSAGKAQNGPHRGPRAFGRALHGRDLLRHPADQSRAVATANVKTDVASQPSTDVAPIHPAAVTLGIDDPHARGRHDNVVDVGSRAGDSSVMEYDHAPRHQLVETRSDAHFSLGALLPRCDRLRFGRRIQDEIAEVGMSRTHRGFPVLIAPFVLCTCRSPRNSDIECGCACTLSWSRLDDHGRVVSAAFVADHSLVTGVPPGPFAHGEVRSTPCT